MTARPWNPRIELDGALQRGDLGYAIPLAAEVAAYSRRPLDLTTALRFLPLLDIGRAMEANVRALVERTIDAMNSGDFHASPARRLLRARGRSSVGYAALRYREEAS